MLSWEEFVEEYNDCVSDVQNADYKSHSLKLIDFFNLLDASYFSKNHIRNLESLVDFGAWYNSGKSTTGSMVGSGNLNWSSNKNERLGQNLSLFRNFSKDSNAVVKFSLNFLYAGSNYNDMIYKLNEQLFTPFSRDLFKYIRRNQNTLGKQEAPASDRIVSLDHNSSEYQIVMKKLEELKDTLRKNNQLAIEEPQDQSRVIAEISAAQDLLKAPRVRVDIVKDIIVTALKYIGHKIADNIVDIAIKAIFLGLTALLGIQVLNCKARDLI